MRRLAILEPLSIFLMIMLYIWVLRSSYHLLWVGILGLVFVSHLVHAEGADSLGFHHRNLVLCLDRFAPLLGLFTLAMLAGGFLLNTTRVIRFEDGLLAWVAYLPWGLFQQYLMNGYFLNRFEGVLSRRAAPVLTAALFSGAHLPNWFLMGVGLVAGYASICIYRKYRNLYFLGLAHGTIGFVLFIVVPDRISHHLTVGPGWFRY